MGGGVLQLLATGQFDMYLSVSPEMSYFKQVYKRHTPFSMQSIIKQMGDVFLNGSETKSCKIDRDGDLLKDVTLCITMPAIYSSDVHRFRWIKNLGNYLIDEYSISVGGQVIDRRWGEWMDVWNELSLSQEQKVAFDTLSGNVQEYMNPKALTPMVIVKNNRMAYSYYPSATDTTPSLPEKVLYIPLDFWFSKNPSLSLPLVAMQYNDTVVNIKFRNIEDLYQVWHDASGQYVSPRKYNALMASVASTAQQIKFTSFLRPTKPSGYTHTFNAYLECNYVFLDLPERTYIASHSFDYLVERVSRDATLTATSTGNGKDSVTLNYSLNNSIKEMIWMLRRRDNADYNDWANYTPEQPENRNKSPLKSMEMLWNGMMRLEKKPGEYYNILQPAQVHTCIPRQGIYAYSFALYPEKLQPSGSFNATVISDIALLCELNGTTEYDVIMYTVAYNVFRVMNGSGGMVFVV